jgi:Holliday junction resolvasome RuvABC endonuclease subunit
MGIDLGVHKIALAVFVEEKLVSAYAHEAPIDLSRDMQLLELASFAHDIGTNIGVDSVWIEDVIIGNNRKYSIGLAQTLGAVLADLAHLRLAHGTDVRTVDNTTWKKAIIGNGHADKKAVRDYIDVTHPAYAPLCGADQDLYDAACVGLYGLSVMERSRDLHL